MENKIYVGDIGTILEAETKKDLSGVSVLRFELIKPNGMNTNWDAAPKIGNPTVAQCTISSDALDLAGVWRGQVYAEWGLSQKWHGQTFRFTVYALGE
ncbi:MAG: hypothetical protein HZA78_08050 [Candidatus Schekmanbacteria bacterium]|nr:hypothetical protein [Candidatus Schekmanbacteria bacterium]